MNLPNQLTVLRFALTCVFVTVMSVEGGLTSIGRFVCLLIAFCIFAAASITDYYDGKIARERNLITNFGKLLDPIVDKVLVSAGFIMLMEVDGLAVPGWAIVAILAREFLVSGARLLAASSGHVIAADMSGKIKAALQLIYVHVILGAAVINHLLIVMKGVPHDGLTRLVFHLSFWGAVGVAVFTLYSGVAFFQKNWLSLDLGAKQ